MHFKPYENESQTLSIGDLNVENRIDRVSLFGSLDVTKDKQGLTYALELKQLLDSIVCELQSADLPDTLVIEAPEIVKNPFR